LREAFARAEPSDTRELLASVVSRIDLFFDRHQHGKYTRTSFREGLIHVRPDPAFTDLSTTSRRSGWQFRRHSWRLHSRSAEEEFMAARVASAGVVGFHCRSDIGRGWRPSAAANWLRAGRKSPSDSGSAGSSPAAQLDQAPLPCPGASVLSPVVGGYCGGFGAKPRAFSRPSQAMIRFQAV
jgi:hypothetical protein